MSTRDQITEGLKNFIPGVEGFSSVPYWDVSRWSWGYGTQAPGKDGTISRDQAIADMVAWALSDYTRLLPQVTQPLTTNQWVALLSFSYNLGVGNAQKLVPVINSGDYGALGDKWNQYIHVRDSSGNLEVSDALVQRRAREWQLWNT